MPDYDELLDDFIPSPDDVLDEDFDDCAVFDGGVQ